MKPNYAENSVEMLRIPPHSIEAEQSVLGGLMLTSEAWEKIADVIIEADFYRKDHRLVFRALADLQENEQPCDVVTVSEWLARHGELEAAGGLPFLIQLANDTPSAANIKAYGNIVREKSVVRQLIDVGTDISDSGYQSDGKDSKELVDQAEQGVFEIAERGARAQQGFIPIRASLKQAFSRIEKLYESPGSITGIATGFTDFDAKTAGLQNSDLIILAGRPAMGKTTLALNIAENAAIKSQISVAVFSMEMPAVQLVTRMISSLGRINQQKLRTGELDDEDWPRITSAMQLLNGTKIFIDETPSLSPTDLRARARRLKREHNLGLVIVDYLQLMQIPGFRENRTQEISEISRGLKALAKELDIPVIALSQLNRSLEQRPNKRPVMADLRESGAIEQDADIICFVYRDEVYNPNSDLAGRAELIIGKQRNGSIGTVHLTFQGQFTRFDNFAPDIYSGDMP